MKSISRVDLERSLKAGRLDPLYLLIGCEGYLRDSAARAITDLALSETLLREFNESSFSLVSGGTNAAIAAADQLPMMSLHRVVRICDFGKLRETEEETLIRYLSNPAPSSVVIFNTADLVKLNKLSKRFID